MRHNKDQSGGSFDRLDNVRNSHDVVSKVNIREVLLVDMGFVDDLSQLLALELIVNAVFLFAPTREE